jgi:hydroxyacylglutathione hydrolase
VRVETIPCLSDNYSYLVGADAGTSIVAVDPCVPEAVLKAVTDAQSTVVAILNTHHHSDHIGGNLALLEAFPGIPVYAHSQDRGRIPGQTHFVEDGEEISAAGLQFTVLFVPGHTRAHVAYLTGSALFVGDTVFGGGCGRLFEGTPETMHQSLLKIANLPDDTLLYFAHEYTAANLRFAESIEPENLELRARVREVQALRAAGGITTPSKVGVERATNPFFRVTEPAITRRFASESGAQLLPAEVFGLVRRAKDSFR